MRRDAASTPNDPTVQLIKMIVWSVEGQQAALSAIERGLPARRGVDLLLRERFPQAYLPPTRRLRRIVGVEVGEVMRRLGHVEEARPTRPERRWKLKPVIPKKKR